MVPPVRIGESRDQVGQRGLAAAIGAHHGNRLAEANREVQVLQHQLVGLVAEADVLEG